MTQIERFRAQGVLDRSRVLHPHPPWHLWDPEQFAVAVVPVYDNSRALAPAHKPDFESFRKKCNLHAKLGARFVGQEIAWEIREAERENERRENHRRRYDDYGRTVRRYRPRGNPGPGVCAKATRSRARAPTTCSGPRSYWPPRTRSPGSRRSACSRTRTAPSTTRTAIPSKIPTRKIRLTTTRRSR